MSKIAELMAKAKAKEPDEAVSRYLQRKRENAEIIEVTFRVRMSKGHAKLWLQSALERVINSSVTIIEEKGMDHEFADINLEDWEEWKQPIVHLWSAMHNVIWCKLNGQPEPDTIIEL